MKTKFSLILALLALQTSFTLGQTTAVPATISYQGRVYTSAGTLLGAGTPVNRTVIFRIWDSPSATLAANLLYSESQTVTVSEGEFSVLVGNGVANTTQTFGYSETAKHSSAAPAVNLADVFNGASRYLSVTVANAATIATSDSEITPRQQIVSSAFAFRSKFAETLGTSTSGSSLRVLDNGNIGIGTASPPSLFTITGTNSSSSTSTPQFLITDGADTNERLRIGIDNTGNGSGFLQSWKEGTGTGTGAQSLLLNPNGGNVGIGTTSPGSSYRLDVSGNIRARSSILSNGSTANNYGEITAGSFDYNGTNGDGVNPSYRGAALRGYGNGTTSDAYNGLNASNKGVLTFQNCAGIITSNGNDISFGNNSTETMRITTDARLGIGTASPVARLSVKSAATNGWPASSGATPAAIMARFQGADNLVLDFGANSGNGAWLQSTDSANLGTSYPLILNPNGGNLGIGINSPLTRLDVNGAIKALGGAPSLVAVAGGYTSANGYSFGSGGDADGGMFSPADGTLTWWTNSSEKMRLNADGNLGIGNIVPLTKLDVTGGIRASGGTPTFVNSSNGWSSSNGYSFGAGGDTDGGMFSPGDGTLTWLTNGSEKMRLTSDGRLGIGLTGPRVPLEVVGSVSLSLYLGGAVWDNGSHQDTNMTYTGAISILAEQGVRCQVLFVNSDKRIKNVSGVSDSATDLATLMKLEITDYLYKDVIANGSRPQKKVIAQQVEKVFPLAVSQGTDVVPDIYQVAAVKEGWIELATDLKAGERVGIVDSKKKVVLQVLEVAEGKFKVDLTGVAASEKVFVLGREVNDFRTVDYEAIAMLNVSATQELNRKVERLEAELAEKNQKISAMEAATEARLIALEKRLGSGESVLHPVSLQQKSSDQ